jgi:hypothetical protein
MLRVLELEAPEAVVAAREAAQPEVQPAVAQAAQLRLG